MRYLAKYLIYATVLAGLAWGGSAIVKDLKADLSRLETIVEQRAEEINMMEKGINQYMQPTDKEDTHLYR